MYHFTPALRNLISHYQTILTPEEHLSFVTEVNRRMEFYLGYLWDFTAGVERGKEIQRLIDNEVNAASNIKVSCRKGCGGCCHLEVQITSDDAEVLVEAMSLGFRIDRTRLRELSKREKNDPAWSLRDISDNRCVFLSSEQACGIYSHRPAVCRKHSVTSDPAECMKERGEVQPLVMPIAEIIMSAAVTINNGYYLALPKMLQEVLDRRGIIRNYMPDFLEDESNSSETHSIHAWDNDKQE